MYNEREFFFFLYALPYVLCILFFTPNEKCHISKQKLNRIIFDKNCCSVLRYLGSLDKSIQVQNILLSAKNLNNVKNYLKNLTDKDSQKLLKAYL